LHFEAQILTQGAILKKTYMDFIKLPTDNFYIFLSLAGIVLLAYFIGLYFKIKSSLDNTKNGVKKEIAKRKKALEYYKEKLKVVKSLAFMKAIIFQKEFNVNFDDYLSDRSESFLIPASVSTTEQRQKFLTNYTEIRELLLNTNKEVTELEENIAILEIDTNMIIEKDKELKQLNRVTYIFVTLGIILSLSGFSFWFFKHQIYQDKLLELNYEMNKLQNKKMFFEDSIRQTQKKASTIPYSIDSAVSD